MQFDRLKRREFIALVGGRTRRSAGTSWREQTRSLERLLQHRFEWVFADHGGSRHLPPEEMHARFEALVARMTRT